MRNLLLQFKYFIIMSLKERESIFWMLAFPIILCTVFYLAFSNLDDAKAVQVKIGIDESNGFEILLNRVPIFEIVKGEEMELKNKLEKEEIDLYLNSQYEPIIKERTSKNKLAIGILEEFQKYCIAFTLRANDQMDLGLKDEDILNYNLKDLAEIVQEFKMDSLFKQFDKNGNLNEKEFSTFLSEAGLDPSLFTKLNLDPEIENREAEQSLLKIILFSSLALFSLNGAYIGINFITIIQGYLSPLAVRISSSPYKKGNLIFVCFVSSVVLNLFFFVILNLYIRYILGIHLYSNMPLTLLITLVSSCFGVSLGLVIGSIKNLSEIHKTNITTALLLTLSFLSGLSGDMSFKQKLEEVFPIVNRLNFANLISESLYQVNIIENLDYLYRNLGLLLLGTGILLSIAILILRRESYDSL